MNSRDIHQHAYWEGKKRRRSSHHPAVQAFAQPKLDLMAMNLRSVGDSLEKLSVLEVGSGSGYMTVWASKCCKSMVASDFSLNMLRLNPAPKRICCEASLLPFRDGTFDCIICTNLLHHVAYPATIVREMRRVSRKYVVLWEPNRNNPIMFMLGLLKHSDRGLLKISLKWLRSLAGEAGLKAVESTSQGLVLPNVTPTPMIQILSALELWLRPHFYLMVLALK